jgi:hypothetical protein
MESDRQLIIEDVVTPLDEEGEGFGEITVNVTAKGEIATVTVVIEDGEPVALDPFVMGPDQEFPLLSDKEKRRATGMALEIVEDLGAVNEEYGGPGKDPDVEVPPRSVDTDEVRVDEDSWSENEPDMSGDEQDSDVSDPFTGRN